MQFPARKRLEVEDLVNLIKQQLSAGDGKLTLETLAGNMGQRTIVIRLALDVLQSAGRLEYTVDNSGSLTLTKGDGIARSDIAAAEKRLRVALIETTAFRRHFASAPVDELFKDFFLK
jgi:hypothetical protein